MYKENIISFYYDDFGEKGKVYKINGRKLKSDFIDRLELLFVPGEYPQITISTKDVDIFALRKEE